MLRQFVELVTFALAYITGMFQQFFQLYGKKRSSIGTQPDIYSLDQAVDNYEGTDGKSANMDFSDWTKSKGSIGSILELVVSPKLDKDQKETVRGYDQKLDAMLALGVFFPQMKDQVNKQIKDLTGGALDIMEVDTLMHKILAKPEKPDWGTYVPYQE